MIHLLLVIKFAVHGNPILQTRKLRSHPREPQSVSFSSGFLITAVTWTQSRLLPSPASQGGARASSSIYTASPGRTVEEPCSDGYCHTTTPNLAAQNKNKFVIFQGFHG